jgi:hypothetical protein
LKSSQQDVYHSLVQRLIDSKLAVGTLNLHFSQSDKKNNRPFDVRKIILNPYFDQNYKCVDAFHGTSFTAL